MTYYVDRIEAGENPHVNYEPSSKGGLMQTPKPEGVVDHTPFVSGNIVRQAISRPCNFKQAGERFRSFEDWERDELISNLVNLLGQCDRDIQERMVSNFTQADENYGRRVAEGLGMDFEKQKSAQTT